jgi:hypothetical protein
MTTKKTAKSSTAGNAKRKVERLEKDLKEAGKKTTNKKCALHKKPIPLHIEQVVAPLPMLIYVGIRETGAFLRTFEEHPTAEDLSYYVFSTSYTPTKKTHSACNAVIGPFRTLDGAHIFSNRDGVNSVEEAEALVR